MVSCFRLVQQRLCACCWVISALVFFTPCWLRHGNTLSILIPVFVSLESSRLILDALRLGYCSFGSFETWFNKLETHKTRRHKQVFRSKKRALFFAFSFVSDGSCRTLYWRVYFQVSMKTLLLLLSFPSSFYQVSTLHQGHEAGTEVHNRAQSFVLLSYTMHDYVTSTFGLYLSTE